MPITPATHTRTNHHHTHPEQSLGAAVPHLEEVLITPVDLDIRRVHATQSSTHPRRGGPPHE